MPTFTTDFYSPEFFASYAFKGATPFCLRSQDSYYMPLDGLSERRFVYLYEEKLFEDIASRTPSRDVWTIAELGFGTGLSFLATLRLWKAQSFSNKALVFVSIEQAPFTPQDLKKVLAPWDSDLLEEIEELCERYKILVPGLNIIPFVKHRVFLIILVGSAEALLPHCSFQADHWMLDGFAPSKNPSAWNDTVLKEISRLSRNQCSLASFSAAGVVRRGLESHGWNVSRTPGFGFKAHITRARISKGALSSPALAEPFRIAGGGIAGQSIAYFRSLLQGSSIILDLAGPQASQAPYIYMIPKVHRLFDERTILNLQTHFFSATLYRDLSQEHGLVLSSSHQEPFDPLNRTHRLFQELSQQPLWKEMVLCDPDRKLLVYPYAIESSGANICALMQKLSVNSQSENYALEEAALVLNSSIQALACAWGAQLWGGSYLPSSILRGEIALEGDRWSTPTHERYAFNPGPRHETGFVGFRSQSSAYQPMMQMSPVYTSLHHGSRGFSSAPWCGLLIALSSMQIFQYRESFHEFPSPEK